MRKQDEKTKKKKMYECANYEFDYDGLGKFHWCHSHAFGEKECICHRVWTMQFCPCYAKGKLRGTFELTKADLDDAEYFKKEVAKRKHDAEVAEYERFKCIEKEYKQLKKKYG